MGSTSQKHHHILPTKTALTIGALLLVLTAITVWIAHIDLGPFNFVIATAVATLKASLVALYFMNLKYESSENRMIFITSFLFLAIFIVLTATDLFFRQEVSVHGTFIAEGSSQSKLKKPWVSTPELVAHGKEIYAIQCVACHGLEGKGNGPAAAALNPAPRNFEAVDGWKNGRKPTMVFKTLKEGLPPSSMASYATLPADDRWALTHYVLSLHPQVEVDSPADFARVGIDPNQESVQEKEDPKISIELAMSQLAHAESGMERGAHLYHSRFEQVQEGPFIGKYLYQKHCLECHGDHGKGGIKVSVLGVYPVAFVATHPLNQQSPSMNSQEVFNQAVIRGIPGNLMPGYGNLSSSELKGLYQYLKAENE